MTGITRPRAWKRPQASTNLSQERQRRIRTWLCGTRRTLRTTWRAIPIMTATKLVPRLHCQTGSGRFPANFHLPRRGGQNLLKGRRSMSPDENKIIVQRFIEDVLNQKNLAAV